MDINCCTGPLQHLVGFADRSSMNVLVDRNLAGKRRGMERQYCVYNQTSECFLSLGVTLADTTFARLKGILGKRAHRFDEGTWMIGPKGVSTLGLFSPRDLIYLD